MADRMEAPESRPAGREIDERIARDFMGDDLGHVHQWVPVTSPDDGYGESHGWICTICEPDGYRGSMLMTNPTDPQFADRLREVRRAPRCYSTDARETERLLKRLRGTGWSLTLGTNDDGWWIVGDHEATGRVVEADATEFPHCVALFALATSQNTQSDTPPTEGQPI